MKGMQVLSLYQLILILIVISTIFIYGKNSDRTQLGNDSRVTYFNLSKDNKDTAFESQKETNINTSLKELRKNITLKETRRKLGPTYATINGYDCYRTVQGMHDTMADLALQNHVFVEMRKIGNSWRQDNEDDPLGYDADITSFIITNRHSYKGKTPIFIVCNMIPAQLAPPEICVRFAEKLIKDRKINGEFEWILDYSEIHMIYQANPDGRVFQENNLNEKIYKNRHLVTACLGTSESHLGTNIDKNFDSHWDQGTKVRCDKMYRGSRPNSEPETQAIRNYITYIMSLVPKMNMGFVVDMHSSNQTIQLPFFNETIFSQIAIEQFGEFASTMARDTRPLFVTNNEPNVPEHGSFLDFALSIDTVAPLKLGIGTEDFEECSKVDQVYKNFETIILNILRVAQIHHGFNFYPVVEFISPLETYPPEFRMKVKITPRFNDTLKAVNLYLDRHPFDLAFDQKPAFTTTNFIQNFDNTTFSTILTLKSLSKGTHIVYIQAVATHGADGKDDRGPVYAHKFSVDALLTYNPTASPTTSTSPTISTSPTTSTVPSAIPTAPSPQPTEDFTILNPPSTSIGSQISGSIMDFSTTGNPTTGNSAVTIDPSFPPSPALDVDISESANLDISESPTQSPSQGVDCGLIPFLPIRKKIINFGRYLGRRLLGSI